MLAEFCEDAAGRFWMEEGDVQPLSTLTGLLVDEAYALLRNFGKTFGHTVLHAEGYVVYALVALVEPLLDGALGACRLQQLQLHLATAQESGLHLLVFNNFCCITLQAQHVCEERQALFDALDGNAQMLNVGNLQTFYDLK